MGYSPRGSCRIHKQHNLHYYYIYIYVDFLNKSGPQVFRQTNTAKPCRRQWEQKAQRKQKKIDGHLSSAKVTEWADIIEKGSYFQRGTPLAVKKGDGIVEGVKTQPSPRRQVCRQISLGDHDNSIY